MFQAMQSVKVDNDKLANHGHAGFVVADRTKVINGETVGEVDVKIDIDNEVYTFDVKDLKGL